MTPYIHYAPGRIRIKSKSLKKNTKRSNLLKALYLEQGGVIDVSLNVVNGSITIKFDQQTIDQHAVLAIATRYVEGVTRQRPKLQTQPEIPQNAPKLPGISKDLAARAGNIAIGFLLEKSVRYSMSNLLGLR